MRITLNTQEIFDIVSKHLSQNLGINTSNANSSIEVDANKVASFHIEVGMSAKPSIPFNPPEANVPIKRELSEPVTETKEVPSVSVIAEEVFTNLEPEVVVEATKPVEPVKPAKRSLFQNVQL